MSNFSGKSLQCLQIGFKAINLSSYFSNQVTGLKVHLKSETWQVLRQFSINLVNGIWWGLKRFQQLSEGVACCMFVDSFFATTLQLRVLSVSVFLLLFLCTKRCIFVLWRALSVCFYYATGDATYPARMWRNMAGGILLPPSLSLPLTLVLQFLILMALFCCCCCRHLRNWRSCWHAITFVLPSRRSSSRIREWLRILHTIILCRNCWRNRVPEVSATKLNKKTNNKQQQRNWKQAMKVNRKMKKQKEIILKIKCKLKWPKLDCTPIRYWCCLVKIAQIKGKYEKQFADNFCFCFRHSRCALQFLPLAQLQFHNIPTAHALLQCRKLKCCVRRLCKWQNKLLEGDPGKLRCWCLDSPVLESVRTQKKKIKRKTQHNVKFS